MANPIAALHERLSAALDGRDPVLRRSGQPQFGDYQANFAMGLAKELGRPPRDVASEVLSRVDLSDLCSSVEVAGPGFVNMTLHSSVLGAAVASLSSDARVGVPVVAGSSVETVALDYSSPNVAREMHVGHLRTTIIGDALARTLEALGHRVVRFNHLGDWGTQFGMLIEHLLSLGWGAGSDAGAHEVSDLNALYREANERFRDDVEFAEQARRRVVSLQRGDAETVAVWRALVEESKRHFDAVYARLDVTLTDADVRGESFYQPMLDEVAASLESSGLARVDDGALCAYPPGFTARDGEPLALIVRKADGGFNYAATDLAGIRFRVEKVGATRLVYVVDARQSLHFAQVFAVARQAGWLPEGVRAEHVPFGTILGPDGRPFRTRSGETPKLFDLLDEAVARATAVVAEKNPSLPPEERAEVGRAVGIGAVKYADLSSDRIKDYVFSWDRMLAFEGNTGPYVQYAHTRARAVLRRASESGFGVGLGADVGEVLVAERAERALVLQLLDFGEAVQSVAETLQPHRLCTYLFDLAQAFTAFYEACPVLRADSTEERSSRLVLCAVTASALSFGLSLLGIDAPERM